MQKVIFFDLFDTLVQVDRGALEPYFTRELDRRGDIGELQNAEATIREMTYAHPYLTQQRSIEEWAKYYEDTMAHALTNINPSVLRMLSMLKDAGYKMCIISDACEVDIKAWEDSPLKEFCENPVFSCRVHIVKPDPELFRLAQKAMGNPEISIFVGDGGHDELIGARAAGMYTIKAEWTKNRREPDICAQADIRMQHPGQLPAFMQLLEQERNAPEQSEPEIPEI